jgi:adenylate kinase family enzyme
MRRVIIIGPGASGNSTLAVKLADIARLPLIGLDEIDANRA